MKGAGIKKQLIRTLGLKPLPQEGGYYRETYQSTQEIFLPLNDLNKQIRRKLCTAIYYLVTREEFSRLHKIKSDEIFHFYFGDPLEMLQITEKGESKKIILG